MWKNDCVVLDYLIIVNEKWKKINIFIFIYFTFDIGAVNKLLHPGGIFLCSALDDMKIRSLYGKYLCGLLIYIKPRKAPFHSFFWMINEI